MGSLVDFRFNFIMFIYGMVYQNAQGDVVRNLSILIIIHN